MVSEEKLPFEKDDKKALENGDTNGNDEAQDEDEDESEEELGIYFLFIIRKEKLVFIIHLECF